MGWIFPRLQYWFCWIGFIFFYAKETHNKHNDFAQLKVTTINFVLYPGFSLSAWKEKQGIALADPLPPWAQVLLLEELDIAQYMESAQCVRGSGLFANSVKTGTDTGFNQNAATTPQCELICWIFLFDVHSRFMKQEIYIRYLRNEVNSYLSYMSITGLMQVI